MSSVIARLNALETEVKTLRTPSLTVFMECLKTATPEEVKAWLVLSREVAATAMAELEEEEPKKVKKVTNAEGPKEWNVFVNTVWHEMAADQGIVGEHDAEFKKACKDAGITYQGVLKEAKRRKAELEGTQPKVKVVKVKEGKTTLAEVKAKVAASAAAKVAPVAKVAAPVAVAVPAVAAAKVAVVEVAAEVQEMADDMGWDVVEHKGETFFYCPSDDTVWNYPAGKKVIGMYTPETAFAEAHFMPNGKKDEEDEEDE